MTLPRPSVPGAATEAGYGIAPAGFRTPAGIRLGLSDGTTLQADVSLWCTGFRSSLDHLAPL